MHLIAWRLTSPVVADGTVSAINVATREIAWRSYDSGVPVDSSPAISGHAMHITARDGTLYAFVGIE